MQVTLGILLQTAAEKPTLNGLIPSSQLGVATQLSVVASLSAGQPMT